MVRSFSLMFDIEKLIYENLPVIKKFKVREPGPVDDLYSYSLFVPEKNDVLFYSKIECGNLRRAIKLSKTEYNLVLEPDTNTKGHMHWFYFKVITKLPKGKI
jgi:hypothetical protein